MMTHDLTYQPGRYRSGGRCASTCARAIAFELTIMSINRQQGWRSEVSNIQRQGVGGGFGQPLRGGRSPATGVIAAPDVAGRQVRRSAVLNRVAGVRTHEFWHEWIPASVRSTVRVKALLPCTEAHPFNTRAELRLF
jgi:hypothetical protein